MHRTTSLMLAAAAMIAIWGTPARATAGPVDQVALAESGVKLSAAEADGLEQKLLASPTDLNSRIKLIGYYYNKDYSARVAGSRERHVLWIIQNRPEAPIAGTQFAQLDPVLDRRVYDKAKNLWLKQTKAKPKNTAILSNAAGFFMSSDISISEGLIQKAAAVEPKSPKWPEKLGQLYKQRMNGYMGETRAQLAAKAVSQFEKASKLTPTEGARFHLAGDLAVTSFEAGDSKKAATYAGQLLATADRCRDDFYCGDAIHIGNNVLGRIALRSGDVQKAKDCLLAAGKTPGSPNLSAEGPNMVLAKELLEKGEKDTVLKYLDLCADFWEAGQIQINGWKKTIEEGKTPDFGANLQL